MKLRLKVLKINQDAVGWINIGNARINYPVVQGKDNEYYLNHNIKNDVQFNESTKSIREKSLYLNSTIPNSKDVILTLSTCSYEFENARFVVHFKLIK